MRISDWSSDVCSSDLEVPERLTSELIVAKARIVARGLRRDFGIDTPRIALAGLNPHAGENGQLGDEEERVMKPAVAQRSEEHTSELQSLMRISYAVFCLKKKKQTQTESTT